MRMKLVDKNTMDALIRFHDRNEIDYVLKTSTESQGGRTLVSDFTEGFTITERFMYDHGTVEYRVVQEVEDYYTVIGRLLDDRLRNEGYIRGEDGNWYVQEKGIYYT